MWNIKRFINSFTSMTCWDQSWIRPARSNPGPAFGTPSTPRWPSRHSCGAARRQGRKPHSEWWTCLLQYLYGFHCECRWCQSWSCQSYAGTLCWRSLIQSFGSCFWKLVFAQMLSFLEFWPLLAERSGLFLHIWQQTVFLNVVHFFAQLLFFAPPIINTHLLYLLVSGHFCFYNAWNICHYQNLSREWAKLWIYFDMVSKKVENFPNSLYVWS